MTAPTRYTHIAVPFMKLLKKFLKYIATLAETTLSIEKITRAQTSNLDTPTYRNILIPAAFVCIQEC
jgi:hypothetical protein